MGEEKGLRKGKKIAFRQISEERHPEAFQFSRELWAYEVEEEKREITKKR